MMKEAAVYLGCSHQWLGKMLGDGGMSTHVLVDYFRFYAGHWRTTHDLLDEYFTNAKIVGTRHFPSEKESNVGKQIQGVP